MHETNEMVAEFSTEAEAQVALEHLREEGISGELKSLGGDIVPVAPFRVWVLTENADRARKVLDQHVGQLDEGWEEAAVGAIEGWICANCDTEVPQDVEVCPECGSMRPTETPQDTED